MNVTELLGELRIPFVENHRSVRHGFVGVETCPYCEHGGCYAAFSRNRRMFSCWSCGSHGFVNTLAKLSGRLSRDVFQLAGGVGYFRTLEERPTGRYEPPRYNENHLLRPHRDYLKSRRVGVKTAWELFKVRAVGLDGGGYAWSLFFPVHHEGRAVSWVVRKVGEYAQARYLASPPHRELLPLKNQLLGMDLVRDTAVVHEGPVDVLRTGPGAVCTFGASYTAAQVAKLARVPRVVVCMDSAGDATGERMGRRLADELSVHDCEVVHVELDVKDTGDPGADREIRRLRRLYLD